VGRATRKEAQKIKRRTQAFETSRHGEGQPCGDGVSSSHVIAAEFNSAEVGSGWKQSAQEECGGHVQVGTERLVRWLEPDALPATWRNDGTIRLSCQCWA